jgi:RND family efflux transporter MFP subunit
MKKKLIKILLGVIIVTAVAGGIYSLNAPKEVPLTKVVSKTAELTFTEQGSVAGGKTIQIYPLSSGKVLSVEVKKGQHVKEGDIICVIDSEDIKEKINQTNGSIAGYKAQMQTWQAQNQSQNQSVVEKRKLQNIIIKQSEKNLELEKKDLDRLLVLYENGFISNVDLEQAESSVEQAELTLQSHQQELELISNADENSKMSDYYKALINIEESNLKLLEKELSQTNVTAVTDGVITNLPVQETNYVSAMSSVAELTATDTLFVETYVSTNDISNIALGDSVVLKIKRRDGDVTFNGTVSYIDDTANIMISPLGLEERKVKIEVTPSISLTEEKLGIGYDVDVQFLLYKEENSLAVPKTALFKDNGIDKVWIVNGRALHAIEVKTGMDLRTETVILSGLKSDSFVVTDSNDEILKEGLKVVTKK